MMVFGNPAGAEAPAPGPHSRAEATSIVADMRRIVTDQGIERLEKVRIGGIEQWVSIRGNDARNPVLLMLHGGPGWVSMPTSWYFQRGWEEYFTVVQWDQRGAGKTYVENDPELIAPTVTPEQMIADTVELVAWLRREYGKEKIFVLGHSWGSYLGLELASRHPDWLHAYIGIGQGTDIPESERRGWAWTMDKARADGNAEAIAELESIAPYAEGDDAPALADVYKQRKWLNHYGGMVHNRTGGAAEARAIALSPSTPTPMSPASGKPATSPRKSCSLTCLPRTCPGSGNSIVRCSCSSAGTTSMSPPKWPRNGSRKYRLRTSSWCGSSIRRTRS
nr:alpha/beta fold hydrolase [Lysobacter alkalisoli]